MKHITQITANIKVEALINSGRFTKFELAEKIGISRPTLDRKIKSSLWKKGEMEIIKNL